MSDSLLVLVPHETFAWYHLYLSKMTEPDGECWQTGGTKKQIAFHLSCPGVAQSAAAQINSGTEIAYILVHP